VTRSRHESLASGKHQPGALLPGEHTAGHKAGFAETPCRALPCVTHTVHCAALLILVYGASLVVLGRSPEVPVPLRPAGLSNAWRLSKPVLAGSQRCL
jgi:hypothetical protein